MTASITSGNLLRERDGGFDLPAVEVGQARQPQAVQDFQPVALRDLRDPVEPVIDRIGADAAGQLLELGEILVDLPGLDMGSRPERILVAAERRIGQAVELAARSEQVLRHFDRRAEPAPDGDDGRRGQGEKSRRNGHVDDFREARPRPTLAYRAGWTVPSALAAYVSVPNDVAVRQAVPSEIIRRFVLAARRPAALIGARQASGPGR